ncbi:MAG: M48 family metalloprotease [bacterium]|nr:M48 family metalloprotease [bacterium]
MEIKTKILIICAVLLGLIGYGITAIHFGLEQRTVDLFEAEEIHEGRPYELLQEVSAQFSRKTPHLYITKNYFFNAAHIPSSTSPLRLRRGKIVISREVIDYFDEQALRGVYAHEISHLIEDPVLNPFFPTRKTLPFEIETDRRAAAYVGFETMQATLRAYEELTHLSWWHKHSEHFPSDPSGTWMGDAAFREFRDEIRQRLDALITAYAKQL